MKSKVIKLSSILVGVFIILAIFGMSPIVAKANEELYFDKYGNLYYITREKKASGSVKYYTIGWIIKRYDMPINVSGQQYVIVTKSNYRPDEVDPNDSKYVYCYYKSDKDEILNAVKSVSKEWYNSLEKYGETVYIDSVMTVLEKGVQQGQLYAGGKYTGEVYFDYEGIANARGWASPESLRVNFNMSVEFPALYRPMSTSITVINREDIEVSNALFMSEENGSKEFDIESGIPSGEKLYVQSNVSKGIYSIKLKKVTGEMKIDVQIPVKYILKWTDYYGVKKEETRVVNRYYTVKRTFCYYEYVGYSEKKLAGIKLSSDLLKEDVIIDYDQEENSSLTEGTVIYDGVALHVLGYELGDASIIAPVVITGNTYLKPKIPEADYSAWAEKLVEPLMVRSDKVVVDGEVILSNEIKRGNACEPTKSFLVENAMLVAEDISIDKEVSNGEDYIIHGEYIFEDSVGEQSTYTMSGLTAVDVHTPVVCNENIIIEKKYNQAVEPQPRDVVLGSEMAVVFNDFGMHRDIKGYGIRSYTPYIKKRQVRCGFDVVYRGIRYEAGTWIDISSYYVVLDVCEDNREGTYNVELRSVAHNAPDIYDEGLIQLGANMELSSYGATAVQQVRLIGKIEKFSIEYGPQKMYATNMPLKISLDDNKEVLKKDYTLSIETVGDIGASDYLEVHYDYYVKDEVGNYHPVWVYQVDNRDIIHGENLVKLPEVDIWGRDAVCLEGNKGVWERKISMPTEIMVVDVGTTIEDVRQAILEDRVKDILINPVSIYVAAEFVRYKDGEAYISYINEENAKKGYCNMWLSEGGTAEKPYGVFLELGVSDRVYYDYEVSGTH